MTLGSGARSSSSRTLERAIVGLCGLLLAGPAEALPAGAALLGPDGPTYVGTLPPSPGRLVTAVIDPRDGRLLVEERLSEHTLSWDGAAWSLDEQPLPAEPDPRFVFDEGRLVSLRSPDGLAHRLRYDEGGRLVGLEWPDATAIAVRYDERGRVRELRGPGSLLSRATWALEADSGEVEFQDSLGRSLRVRRIEAGDLGAQGQEVEDALGRVARLWTDAQGAVSAWQDPRGGLTRVSQEPGRLRVERAAGLRWEVEVDSARRPLASIGPGGERWRWERDVAGRVVRIVDGAGRTTLWTRDTQERVIGCSTGGRLWRIGRDSAGRIVGITDPNGAVTTLSRDSDGRVSSIVDAAGNTLLLGRGAGGELTTITERDGGRWLSSVDLTGRVDRLTFPGGRTVDLERDPAGRLIRITDSVYGVTRFDRAADGALTRVLDPAGRATGMVRDAAGRVSEVRRPDGQRLQIVRDPNGDVSRVTLAESSLEITRDALGLPTGAGPIRWLRDGAGRVAGLEGPGISLRLSSDGAGLLRGLSAGGWTMSLDRSPAGEVTRWSGTDGEVRIERDAAGREVGEVVRTAAGVVETRFNRDLRGQVERVTNARGVWRYGRDATGRVLSVEGPEGLRVGLDRAPGGEVRLFRFPDGAFLRLKSEGDRVEEELVGSDGRTVLRRTTAFDRAGRPKWRQEGDLERESWRTDPLGRLVTIELPDGRAWSWAAGEVQGPDGERVVDGARGLWTEAAPGIGPPAWGAGELLVRATRESGGRLSRVQGEGGSARLAWDALGRLQAVERLSTARGDSAVPAAAAVGGASPGGSAARASEMRSFQEAIQRWALLYDARGRPAAIASPGAPAALLAWGPEAASIDRRLEGRGGEAGGLLASGPSLERAWIQSPWGAAGQRVEGRTRSLLHFGDGDARYVSDPGLPLIRCETSPSGRADSGAAGFAGPAQSLQLFPGGPLFTGGRAFDPLDGQPIDGWATWPWSGLPLRGDPELASLDPAAWAPESAWWNPLALLQDLDQLGDIDVGGWWEPAPARAFEGLPAGIQGARPPLGPSLPALPLEDDRLTVALLTSLLPGGSPLDGDALLSLILEDDAAELNVLPGLRVPGAEALQALRPSSMSLATLERAD